MMDSLLILNISLQDLFYKLLLYFFINIGKVFHMNIYIGKYIYMYMFYRLCKIKKKLMLQLLSIVF